MLLKIKILLILCFCIFLVDTGLAAHPKILVLYNYHPLQCNTMEIMHTTTQGIRSLLPEAVIYSEFYDVKRFPPKKHEEVFYNYLLNKYKQEKPDLILAYLDTAPIAFRLRHAIAPNVRVVYNFLQNEDDVNFNPDLDVFFSLSVDLPFEENLALYHKWFPELRNVFVVSDHHPASELFLQKIREAISHQVNPYNLMVWIDESPDDIIRKTKKLRAELSLVVFASFEGRLGGEYAPQDQKRLVTEANVPVLLIEESEIFDKTLGGYFFSYKKFGFFIGQSIARLVNKEITSIPETKKNEFVVYKVNYKAFPHFKLNEKDIPAGALVLNPPARDVYEYNQIILYLTWALVLIMALVLGVVLLPFGKYLSRKMSYLVLKNSNDLVFYFSPEGLLLDLNSAAVLFCQKTKQKLKSTHIAELDWLGHTSLDFAQIKEYFLKNSDIDIRFTFEGPKDGSSQRVIDFSLRSLRGRKKILGLVLVGKDVTSWVHDEDKIREAREQYKILFEKSPFPSWVICDHLFADCNQKAVEVLGYSSRSEILNLHPSFLSPDSQNDGQNSFSKADEMMNLCLQKGSHSFKWLHKKKNGEIFPVDVRLIKVPWGHNSSAIFCVWQDETFSWRERELGKEQFEQLTNLHRRSENLYHAKTSFLKIIGHKIRNPLNVMMGASEVLSETDLKMDQEQLVRMVMSSAKNLLEFLSSAMDFTFTDELSKTVDHKVFSLRKELDGLYRHFSSRSFNKGLLFEVLFDEVCPDQVIGDARRLRQALFLLLDNAIKFAEAGSVTLRVGHLTSDPKLVQFAIIDTGNGFSQEEMEYYFSDNPGTKESFDFDLERRGIGIFLARDLVRAMGGKVGALSSMTTGTTLYFSLPLEESSLAIDVSRNPIPDSRKIFMPLNVLIADGSDENRDVFLLYLRKMATRIEFSVNGLVAFEKFKANSFNLVLLDVQIPKVNSLELLKEMRRIEKERNYKKVLIIVLSLARDEELQQKMLDAGADAVLLKPVSNHTLQKKIAEFLL